AIDAATGQWHAIDDDERVVAGIERRPGTDTDGTTRSRPATIGRDLYAGSFPRNQLFRRGDGPFLEILGGYGGHGTGQLPFTLGTVADDDHFFQAFRRGHHREGHTHRLAGNGHRLRGCLVTDKGGHQGVGAIRHV